MILAINYADKRFYRAQKLNSHQAKKVGGADKVIEYTPHKLGKAFIEENKHLMHETRGGGYWVWKPYIILDALNKINDDDYLVYTDSGSVFVDNVQYLIDDMERAELDVMCFAIDQVERKWCKRDALILMDCDDDKYLDTAQRCTGYIILKKTERAKQLITEWYAYNRDRRVVTDDANVLGKENYSVFVENRHDQTIFSLLTKKYGIPAFRDPSEWGLDKSLFAADVLERSHYGQVIWSHRKRDVRYMIELTHPEIARYFDYRYYRKVAIDIYNKKLKRNKQ